MQQDNDFAKLIIQVITLFVIVGLGICGIVLINSIDDVGKLGAVLGITVLISGVSFIIHMVRIIRRVGIMIKDRRKLNGTHITLCLFTFFSILSSFGFGLGITIGTLIKMFGKGV